jgi:putative addiction module component (TIGR02574 family)
MSSSSEQILKDALALPAQERAALLERLLVSFQSAPAPNLDELWIREAEERLEAYNRGELKAVPVEAVLERIKQAACKMKIDHNCDSTSSSKAGKLAIQS